MIDLFKKIYLNLHVSEKPQWCEISILPNHPSGCQRNYIDDIFTRDVVSFSFWGYTYYITGGTYGHCEDYPRGFKVCLQRYKNLEKIGI